MSLLNENDAALQDTSHDFGKNIIPGIAALVEKSAAPQLGQK